jgi:hypothetical protein
MTLDVEALRVIVNRKPLLRVLQLTARHDGGGPQGGGISTRRLLHELGANGLHREIMEAERLGYTRREKVKKPKGQKGNYLIVNRLTDSGRQVVVKTAKVLGLAFVPAACTKRRGGNCDNEKSI